jgi:hypothetical protein
MDGKHNTQVRQLPAHAETVKRKFKNLVHSLLSARSQHPFHANGAWETFGRGSSYRNSRSPISRVAHCCPSSPRGRRRRPRWAPCIGFHASMEVQCVARVRARLRGTLATTYMNLTFRLLTRFVKSAIELFVTKPKFRIHRVWGLLYLCCFA